MSVTGVLLAVTCLGVLAAALGVAAATDLSCRIVPNGCAIAVAAAGALRAAVPSVHHHDMMPLLSSAGGGLVVLVVMLAAAGLSARAGHGPGVGGGDVKLLSAVGFWVGPVGGLLVVGLSCAVGLVAWCLGRAIAAARAAGPCTRTSRQRFGEPQLSKVHSESGDMRGGFGSLAPARLPYAGRRPAKPAAKPPAE